MDANRLGRPARGVLGDVRGPASEFVVASPPNTHRSDERRTSIELFQIWINLPASQKFDPPSIRYLGAAHGAPWHEEVVDGTRVRTVLDAAIIDAAASDSEGATPNQRPRAEVYHAHIPAGGAWAPKVGADSSCSLYCREGKVQCMNQIVAARLIQFCAQARSRCLGLAD